ncbi:class I SAM-dependent DNA methyltransferase [Halpernia frigidisoli]|uniref:Methyltransferase domain-containing protein n=1 Tax=Halpernia frigidisoli TaxID=1125876 RepID=A0A1I3IXS4_9FLAO|nr:class I SAM-dependent methyltransferase [Halpernia frigidisoli]SFI52696.1 Methyltransferase domain-containing protein [Halpernia frigidisoli]
MEWFETWFNTPYYHILYKDRDYEEGERFLEKLVESLNLKPKAKIIDLACGKGRHSVFLNKIGFHVLGLDLSEKSILFDKKYENPDLHFAVHDIRNEIESEKVNAVFNLFTSFGYFKTDEEDQKVFTSVSNILEKNGLFVLDFLNAEYVKNHIEYQSTIRKGEIDFHIKKTIENNHVIKEITFHDDGQDFKFEENVKLLDLEDINNFAKNSYLKRIKIWGDYQLNEFDVKSSPRCINVFKKIK